MKNKIIYICVLVIFSVGFFFLGRFMHQPTPASQIDEPGTVKLEMGETETARLSTDGSEVKMLTNTYSTNRNFIFLENKTGDTVATLSINNPALWTPYYHIIKGHAHDWLVVTRVERWGTGMRDDFDEWYILGRSGTMKMVLSYESQNLRTPGTDGKNRYTSTDIMNEIYPDDFAMDIKATEKICSIAEDGSDKDCSESSKIIHYVWDGDKEEFMLK